MCDGFSFASAISSVGGGIAGAIDARGRADFEAMQLEAMGVFTQALAWRNEGVLRKDYDEAAQKNIAAMAISGFAFGSFDSIKEGNQKNLNENIVQLHHNAKLEKDNLETEKNVRLIEGKAEASALFIAGLNTGFATLKEADSNWRRYNTGESRVESFFNSVGWS